MVDFTARDETQFCGTTGAHLVIGIKITEHVRAGVKIPGEW